jgi:hypothetical protein
MSRRTDDPMRDLPLATREGVKRKLQTLPHAARLAAVLEGEEDDSALGRIFGEELPSGLVLEAQERGLSSLEKSVGTDGGQSQKR